MILKIGRSHLKILQKPILLALWVGLFLGCQVARNYVPPATAVPDAWKHSPEMEQQASAQKCEPWWKIFNDETLNEYEALALENNYDLHIAFDRVIQARALAGAAASELYPHLNLEPYYHNRDVLWMKFGPTTVLREHRRRNHFPIVLRYELDLWGKIRKAYEAAELSWEAEVEALRVALLILTSDVAVSYFKIRMYDAETVLLSRTLDARRKAYEIEKSRYDAKIADYTAVSQAEYEYKNTEAKYYDIMRQRDFEENKMAVLLGLFASDFAMAAKPLENIPPLVPVGLPSAVLLQRPDIAEAERVMASEHALIGVAYASFFPSISLTGALGYSSPELKDFLRWKSRYWQLGADFFQTIFDAGLLISNFELAIAKFREAYDAYKQTVLVAFQEVEDALADLEGLGKEYQSVEDAVKAAQNTYRIASDRYKKGVTFYLEVVDSERQELEAQRALIELLGLRYIGTVELIKSFGGSW